jgi:addiction module HigA family antidote
LHVRDEIETLGLPIGQAASALGITRSQLHRIVSGQSGISAEMALRLETVLNGSADMWLRLQAAYDVANARKRASEIVGGLPRLAATA